jgi:hypothetical protein
MRDPHLEYRRENGTILIELRLNRLAQLFNTFDPAPFHERDLDDDAESYIVACVREIPRRHPYKLVIQLPPEEAGREDARQVQAAIRHYFLYRAQAQRREMRQVFREGRWGLLAGLVCLFSCLGLRALLALIHSQRAAFATEIVSEGLLIIGWVAMWRPLDTFLYNWHPILQMLKIYRGLSRVPIEVRAQAGATPAERKTGRLED